MWNVYVKNTIVGILGYCSKNNSYESTTSRKSVKNWWRDVIDGIPQWLL